MTEGKTCVWCRDSHSANDAVPTAAAILHQQTSARFMPLQRILPGRTIPHGPLDRPVRRLQSCSMTAARSAGAYFRCSLNVPAGWFMHRLCFWCWFLDWKTAQLRRSLSHPDSILSQIFGKASKISHQQPVPNATGRAGRPRKEKSGLQRPNLPSETGGVANGCTGNAKIQREARQKTEEFAPKRRNTS